MSKLDIKCSNWLDDGMCGILPVYDEHGTNSSLILFEEKSYIHEPHRVDTVVNRIAKLYHKDISLIKKEVRKITKQRTFNPLPIIYRLVLVPFKMRRPIGRDDGSMGYIFESSIINVDEDDSRVYISLTNGQTITVLESLQTAMNRTALAQYIVTHMSRDSLYNSNPNFFLNSMGKRQSSQSVKEEVLLLFLDFLQNYVDD